MKKCIYCKVEIPENIAVDVCKRCGFSVWGEKMFNAIIENMNSAKEEGNLEQGSISTDSFEVSEKLR